MTYRIKQSSLGLFIIALYTLIFGLGLIFIFLNRGLSNQQTIYVVSLVVFVFTLLYIPKLISSANTEITLDNEGIEQIWISQFIFHKRQDLKISWNEIEDYVFEPDRQFDQFKLHLKDGTLFRFFHNHDHKKDDFKQFINDFSEKVKEINEQSFNNSNNIKIGKRTYTWQVSVLAGFAVFLTIGIPIILIAHKSTMHFTAYNFLGLIAAYIFGMFILIKRIKYLRNGAN